MTSDGVGEEREEGGLGKTGGRGRDKQDPSKIL